MPRPVWFLLIACISAVTPAYGQIKADQVNGTDAFNQISNALAVLNTGGGIIDATNLKAPVGALNIVHTLSIDQSNVKIELGAVSYVNMTSPASAMIAIGDTASVNNVEITGQGDKATIINCYTANASCITIGSTMGTGLSIGHVHIHDLTIVGTTVSNGRKSQDCILIMAHAFPRIDSIEIDHVHFETCGHSNIDAIGVTNLRIHDNTFDGSGFAGLAFPIAAPCAPQTAVSNSTVTGSGDLVTVTLPIGSPIYPAVGDYVWIHNTNLALLNGAFKVVDSISPSSYQIITNQTLPPPGNLGATNLITCDNGIWIDRNVINDYGISDTQEAEEGTIGGISLTYSTEGHLTSLPAGQGEVTGFVNVHITNNIIKCQSNGGDKTSGQNNKLVLRVNAVADSQISGNNLIACGAGNVSAENVASVAYHLGIENNDFWNSELNTGCLSITQQTPTTAPLITVSCPNNTCGSQGYVVHGNRFHNCGFTDIYMTVDEDQAIVSDNDISDNIGDDSVTGYSTFGLVFSNYGDGCNTDTFATNGCKVSIFRSHVHDNIWGNLPGTTVGDGIDVNIGNQMGTNQAAIKYSMRITGGLDIWGNNSAVAGSSIPQEMGFVRRNLKDIYCATDRPSTGDTSCDPSPTANSDYGGTGPLTGTSLKFVHKYTGTYATAPKCNASDTTNAAVLTVVSTLTPLPAELTITGGTGAILNDIIAYTCNPVVTHN
jgi:hypothetical protein